MAMESGRKIWGLDFIHPMQSNGWKCQIPWDGAWQKKKNSLVSSINQQKWGWMSWRDELNVEIQLDKVKDDGERAGDLPRLDSTES